jgi:hypothetical protein
MMNSMATESPARPGLVPPGVASIEVTEDTPILVLPLADRHRLFRRRRQMVHLREWIGVAGITVLGMMLTLAALVSFLAH